jgi:hypothetical protein
MTDYEIVNVLNEFVGTTWAIFATYVSIVVLLPISWLR